MFVFSQSGSSIGSYCSTTIIIFIKKTIQTNQTMGGPMHMILLCYNKIIAACVILSVCVFFPFPFTKIPSSCDSFGFILFNILYFLLVNID